MTLTLSIDRGRDEPVYEQVASQLRRLIASGALEVGLTLPSVRQLSRDLGVSLNTVARAYRLLESEGFLLIRDRAGVSVAAPAAQVNGAARDELLEQLRALLARLRQAGVGSQELLEQARDELQALDDGPGGP